LIERNFKTVILSATGPTISKACVVADILRHRVKGLALVNQISNCTVKDVYEPLEEGLDRIEMVKELALL
jgi:DNA-binding protein